VMSWTGYIVRIKTFYAAGISNLTRMVEKCVSIMGEYIEEEWVGDCGMYILLVKKYSPDQSFPTLVCGIQ
jgi:hypothetical protein